MNFETPLCEIAYRHGVDRCPQINHGYTPFYWRLLNDRRESVKKVAELGVGSRNVMTGAPDQYRIGAGLLMWREFFPNARIFGCDIDPEAKVVGEDRIETFVLDTTKEEDLKTFVGETGSDIDLLIDDSVHWGCCQVPTCLFLMPHLNEDGIYIIEDVQNANKVVESLKPYKCEIFTVSNRKRDRFIVVRHSK